MKKEKKPGDDSNGFCFQAEDGIRDYKVTGVQTCALPILKHIICLGVPLKVVSNVQYTNHNAKMFDNASCANA